MIRLFTKYKSIFTSYKLFSLLGILTLFPFLVLALFNQPATDDYYFSYYTKLYSITESPFWMYNNVGGRYLANTILCFNPVYFNCFFLFKIIPIGLLSLFCISIYYFVESLLPLLNFYKKTAVVGLFCTLFFVQLPDSCSAFYWLPGAITNQLPISLSLLFYVFTIKFYTSRKTKYFLMSVGFLIMTLGCNEIVIIINLFILFIGCAYTSFVIKRHLYALWLLFIIALIFSSIEVIAPGNLVRAKAIPVEHDLIYASVHALASSIDYFFKWVPLLLLFCCFFIEDFYKRTTASVNNMVLLHPIWALGIVFAILAMSFFIGFWINRNLLPDRTINTVYFFYIVSLLYFAACSLMYFKEKHDFTISITSSTKLVLGLIISLFLFANTPIYNAYRDLFTGKAYKYHQEINERLKIVLNSQKDTITVPALKNKPQTIFKPIIMGLTTDINDWKNEEISKYYNKNIVVQPTDSTFTE